MALLDAEQLKVLNDTYNRTAFPSTEERIELAKKLGMSARSVQIWCVSFAPSPLYAIAYYSFINVTTIAGFKIRGRQCDRVVGKHQAPSLLLRPSRSLRVPLLALGRLPHPHHNRQQEARTGACPQ